MTPDPLEPLRKMVEKWPTAEWGWYDNHKVRQFPKGPDDCANDLAAALPALEEALAKITVEYGKRIIALQDQITEMAARVENLTEALDHVLAIEHFTSLDAVRYGDESIKQIVLHALGRKVEP